MKNYLELEIINDRIRASYIIEINWLIDRGFIFFDLNDSIYDVLSFTKLN